MRRRRSRSRSKRGGRLSLELAGIATFQERKWSAIKRKWTRVFRNIQVQLVPVINVALLSRLRNGASRERAMELEQKGELAASTKSFNWAAIGIVAGRQRVCLRAKH